MSEFEINEKYMSLIDSIDNIISETNSRVLSEQPDQFFEGNLNFFVKAYLITICTYLESYLKDIAYYRVELITERVQKTKLPQNLIRWYLAELKDLKDSHMKYEDLAIKIKKTELGDHISGQPHRTVELFSKIGLDLKTCEPFLEKKEEIKNIVVKRNKIIHHNDDASDTTLTDLLTYTTNVRQYISAITDFMSNSNAPLKEAL